MWGVGVVFSGHQRHFLVQIYVGVVSTNKITYDSAIEAFKISMNTASTMHRPYRGP